jgi:hypothetical protein
LTVLTMPRHLLLRPASIASGFLTFNSFPGLLAPRPAPNLEDQASECISPGDWVAQLYLWTLGSSGTLGSPFPVSTCVGPWGELVAHSLGNYDVLSILTPYKGFNVYVINKHSYM